VKTLTSGIVVGSKEPPSKKFKADDQVKPNLQTRVSSQSMLMTTEASSSKQSHHQKADPSASAPPRMLSGKAIGKSVCVEQKKSEDESVQVISRAQARTEGKSKPISTEGNTVQGEMSAQNEKVHIPDNFEESDADSETLSEILRSIDAYTEVIPGTRSKEGQDDHQVWHMEVDGATEGVSHIMNEKLLNKENC
jgi:hypothetical protein